jgi:GNAT superfamily N-acetyltransferase
MIHIKENEMKIRKADQEDIGIIVDFQVAMAWETENLKLQREVVTKGVTWFFDNPSMGHYWLAYEESKIAGSMLIQYEWSDWRNCMVWWIHSVYVLPEYREKGVFKLLYKHVQELVSQSEVTGGLRLFVDLRNNRAREVYKKLGMNGDHYQLFEWMIR